MSLLLAVYFNSSPSHCLPRRSTPALQPPRYPHQASRDTLPSRSKPPHSPSKPSAQICTLYLIRRTYTHRPTPPQSPPRNPWQPRKNHPQGTCRTRRRTRRRCCSSSFKVLRCTTVRSARTPARPAYPTPLCGDRGETPCHWASGPRRLSARVPSRVLGSARATESMRPSTSVVQLARPAQADQRLFRLARWVKPCPEFVQHRARLHLV